MANVAAAQYLRMSTEHQQYSLVNQAAAIQQYAEAHGFSVAQTYSDGARNPAPKVRSTVSTGCALKMIEDETGSVPDPSETRTIKSALPFSSRRNCEAE